MGDATSAGGQERRKIASLTAAPGGQTGKVVRGGQFGLAARRAAPNVWIAHVACLKIGPGLDASLPELV